LTSSVFLIKAGCRIDACGPSYAKHGRLKGAQEVDALAKDEPHVDRAPSGGIKVNLNAPDPIAIFGRT
jgi:hypothetical protein